MTAATDTKRRALGKGLDSLLPRVQPTAPAAAENEGGKPREIPLEQIDRNPFQTRTIVNEDSWPSWQPPSPPTVWCSRSWFARRHLGAFN